jgi:histidyl-tRNA synthetase
MATKEKAKKSATKEAGFQSVKGMHDLLSEGASLQEKIFKIGKDVLEFYNFSPIITPIVEPLGLFARTTGETTDIVEKQMFTVKTKSSEMLALRPEFTPGISRAYIEHSMSQMPHPVKLYTCGPLFRYEQPQAGRLRQFNQIDAEIFSTENDAIYDAQGIIAAYRILDELKIKNIVLEINTIGCKTCRPVYRKALVSYYKSKEKDLCADCKRRLPINPLRLLDCKQESCKPLKEGAPTTLDSICAPCKKHFKEVLEYLDNINIPYSLNNFLVRGLDYYSKTVFELSTQTGEGEEHLGFALGGGGRYDYLVEELGGKSTAAFGFALGVERIIEVLRHRKILPSTRTKEKVFLIHIGDMAKKRSLNLIETLREARIGVTESLGKESLGAQLRSADKAGAPLALIFGQKEAYEESIIIRDMKTGAQEMVPLVKLADMIKRKLS